MNRLVATLMLICLAASAAVAEILYRGDSLYNTITVKQEGSRRCMYFGREVLYKETCFDLNDMDKPLLEYSSLMFLGFLMKPDTENVVLLGLGGGYIPYVLRTHLPDIKVDSVEVDEKVVELARNYFGFVTNDNHTIHTVDGRNYLRKAETTYDQIMIDAFLGDSLPAHMTTKEFLELCKKRLKPKGVVIQNCFYDVKLFDYQVHTFREVFDEVYIYTAQRYANAVVIAGDDIAFGPAKMGDNLSKFDGRIGAIDLSDQMDRLQPNMRIHEAKVLTDEWSPANLLLKQKRKP